MKVTLKFSNASVILLRVYYYGESMQGPGWADFFKKINYIYIYIKKKSKNTKKKTQIISYKQKLAQK